MVYFLNCEGFFILDSVGQAKLGVALFFGIVLLSLTALAIGEPEFLVNYVYSSFEKEPEPVVIALFAGDQNLTRQAIVVGDNVMLEDNIIKLNVYPHTASSPVKDFRQIFEVTNKTGLDDQNLWIAYVFDEDLVAGNIDLWQPSVFEWVETSKTCDYNVSVDWNFSGSPNPHRASCELTRDFVDGNTGLPATVVDTVFVFDFNYNVGKTAYQKNLRETGGRKWLNVTSYMNKFNGSILDYNNKSFYYTTTPLVFGAGETKKWKIRYKTSAGSGKWSLVAWSGSSWSCIKDNTCTRVWEIDPWWDSGYSYKRQITICASADVNSALGNRYTIRMNEVPTSTFSSVQADGDDLRIVHQDTTEIDRNIACGGGDCSAGDANILFRPSKGASDWSLDSGSCDTNFHLYYGHATATSPPIDLNNILYSTDANTLAYWRLDQDAGNAVSVHGGGVTGTSTGMTYASIEADSNIFYKGAVRDTDNADNFALSDNSILNLATAFTIEFRLDNNGTGQGGVVCSTEGGVSNQLEVLINLTTNKVNSRYWGESAQENTSVVANRPLPEGRQKHVAIVANGNWLKIYYDGEMVADGAVANEVVHDGSNQFKVLASCGGGGGVAGNYDEFFVSKTAFTTFNAVPVPPSASLGAEESSNTAPDVNNLAVNGFDSNSQGLYFRADLNHVISFWASDDSYVYLATIKLVGDSNYTIKKDLNLGGIVGGTADANCSRLADTDGAFCYLDFNPDDYSVSDGNYAVDVNVTDISGLEDYNQTQKGYFIDGTAPSTSDDHNAGWQTNDAAVILTCSDAGSGCSGSRYRLAGGARNDYNSSGVLIQDGNIRMDYNSVDNVGNVESEKTIWVAVDKVAPTGSDDHNAGFQATDANVVFSCSDGTGTCSNDVSLRIGSGSYVTINKDLNGWLVQDGNIRIDYGVVDMAGHDSNYTIWVSVDKTTPSISDDHNAGWQTIDANIILTVSCGKSNCTTQYRKDLGAWSDLNVDQNGIHIQDGNVRVDYNTLSGAGLYSPAYTIWTAVDKVAPTTTDDHNAGWQNTDANVILTCADTGGSTCQNTRYRLAGGAWKLFEDTNGILIQDGNIQIDYNSMDVATNEETSKTIWVAVDKPVDVNNVRINWKQSGIFNGGSDGNVSIQFDVVDPPNSNDSIDINIYVTNEAKDTNFTVTLEQSGDGLAADPTVDANCSGTDFDTVLTCSYDLDLSTVLANDGNFFIIIDVDDKSSRDSNTSALQFQFDTNAPQYNEIRLWDVDESRFLSGDFNQDTRGSLKLVGQVRDNNGTIDLTTGTLRFLRSFDSNHTNYQTQAWRFYKYSPYSDRNGLTYGFEYSDHNIETKDLGGNLWDVNFSLETDEWYRRTITDFDDNESKRLENSANEVWQSICKNRPKKFEVTNLEDMDYIHGGVEYSWDNRFRYQVNTTKSIDIWLCDSNYTTGDFTASSSCTLLEVIETTDGYDNPDQNTHHISFASDEAKKVNGLELTNRMYFVMDSPAESCAGSRPWQVATYNTVDTNAMWTTTNGGTSWTALDVGSHQRFHAFDVNHMDKLVVRFSAQDLAGNDSNSVDNNFVYAQANDPPNVLIENPLLDTFFNGTIDINGLCSDPDVGDSVTVDLNLLDANNGATRFEIVSGLTCVDNNFSTTFDTTQVATDFNYQIKAIATDSSGLTEDFIQDRNFFIDNNAPTIWDDHNSGWQRNDANIQVSCSDGIGIGCNSILYSLEQGAWINLDWDKNGVFVQDGNIRVDVNVWDDLNNMRSTVIWVGVDRVVPVISTIIPSSDVGINNTGSSYTALFSGNFVDSYSGMSYVWFKLYKNSVFVADFNETDYNMSYVLSSGDSAYVVVRGVDAVGNISDANTSSSISFTQTGSGTSTGGATTSGGGTTSSSVPAEDFVLDKATLSFFVSKEMIEFSDRDSFTVSSESGGSFSVLVDCPYSKPFCGKNFCSVSDSSFEVGAGGSKEVFVDCNFLVGALTGDDYLSVRVFSGNLEKDVLVSLTKISGQEVFESVSGSVGGTGLGSGFGDSVVFWGALVVLIVVVLGVGVMVVAGKK